MTFYEFAVPVLALALAGAAVIAVRIMEKQLKADESKRHPAE